MATDFTDWTQVIGYLAATHCPIGLLLNFAERSLHPRRVFPPTKLIDHQVNRQWLFIPDWLKESRKIVPPPEKND